MRILLKRTVLVAVFAAAVGLVSTAFGMAGSAGVRGAVCGQGPWATTALGTPRMLASGATGYSTWYDKTGWHLRVRADAGKTLTGTVSSNAALRVVRASAALKATMKTAARSFSFTVSGTGSTEAVDFVTACSRRVTFYFGPAPAFNGGLQKGAPTAPSATDVPVLPVFLGTRGQAPAQGFKLHRPIATGVSGQILVGPTCPVENPQNPCKPQAGSGRVRIERATSSRGHPAGQLVAMLQTDAQGRFTKDLAPGRYLLVVVTDKPGFPLAKPAIAQVQAGVVTQTTLWLDTGIR